MGFFLILIVFLQVSFSISLFYQYIATRLASYIGIVFSSIDFILLLHKVYDLADHHARFKDSRIFN